MLIFRYINGRVVPMEVQHEYQSARTYQRLHKPGKKQPTSWLAKEHFRSSAAYVNPNAKCPVCGAEIFYYEHSNGAKVYFDELGPPWPKHPCTDNGYFNTVAPTLFNREKQTVTENIMPHTPSWRDHGWIPAKVTRVSDRDSLGNFEVTCQSEGLLFSVRITLPTRKKLHIGLESVKDALIQQRQEKNQLTVSIQSGISEKTLDGVILGKVVPAHTDSYELKQLKLQMPNDDGSLALLIGHSEEGELFFIFDLTNTEHKEFMDGLIKSRESTFLHYTKSSQSTEKFSRSITEAKFSSVSKIESHPIQCIKRFLTPSQRAEAISKGKAKRGGNSSMADAFKDAFKNQSKRDGKD
ncbi:hypothetical protein ADINL_1240 [Nitrincola lacisaponensis]|uniref:Uncharacterized protein n=1 Tax=Nitrincola lacisaponensis TaxID=267850 RepID=A0A063Y2U7_9GAMM|nr:hypothetical protein [Nitrincola lacisaponensis]KDE40648.1 hypothetical protein ADINL_1240 [Nitrincola lacisaponensis]